MEKKNEVLEISFKFALMIIELSEELELRKKFVISKQILRSGTSVGANIREAQSAESKADFIHKLKIAHKETLETEYWLDLIKTSPFYPTPDPEFFALLLSIKKLLNSIIYSTKNK